MRYKEKIMGLKEVHKIGIIYFFATLISLIIASVLVKDEFSQGSMKSYIWVLLGFSIVLMFLATIFKVKFKSMAIFLVIMMILLMFVWINREVFFELGVTPTEHNIFVSILGTIGFIITLPFQSIIHIANAYSILELAPILIVGYFSVILLCVKYSHKKI